MLHLLRVFKLPIIFIILISIFGAAFAYYKKEQRIEIKKSTAIVLGHSLDELLSQIPGAVIARMTVINTKDVSKETYPRHTWSVIAARAAPGFIKGPGPMVKDMPLSTWRTWL